jgi:nicotinamidase-related amidase
MEALVIIDMQNACFELAERHDRTGTASRINQLSQYFRRNHKPVIFIQHDGTKEDYMFPNTREWEIIPELEIGPKDLFVKKTANDAFYRSNLEDVLKTQGITTLYVTGLATDFCVNATIHSALVKDYHIVVVKECHTTADRPGLSAMQLIDFHNWLWPNLTPTQGRVDVKALEAIIQ